jgi:hypothetical protein
MKQVPHIGVPRKAKKPGKSGQIPDGKFGVYDGKGNLRGQVGPKATQATAARFGANKAELKQKDGRLAWVGQTLAEVSATGTNPAMPPPQIKTGGSTNG